MSPGGVCVLRMGDWSRLRRSACPPPAEVNRWGARCHGRRRVVSVRDGNEGHRLEAVPRGWGLSSDLGDTFDSCLKPHQVGLPHCSAHGLRKAGTKIAAENKATVHQLMSIYGWETQKQAELYTREATMIMMAAEAMR